jgi:thiamine biosynthesis lipoprotein
MGTDIELLVEAEGADEVLAAAEAEFDRLEQVMSRFRPTSELSQLNDAGQMDASSDLLEAVRLALAARARTNGRFDPTVLGALVAAGYDRTFDDVPAEGPIPTTDPAFCGGGVQIDGSRITLGPGVRLDLGGIGKGFAAERAASLLAASGPCLVSAGGDIAVRGVPECGVWPVAVADDLTLGLSRGGLATSGTERRRWRRGDTECHHLIDPATGRPAVTDILRVTAIGSDAVDAEVLATSLFLGGADDAVGSGLPVVVTTVDGRTIVSGGIR